MDPITHAVVGMLIGTKAGAGISLANGAMVASTLGAVAPDFDIVAQLWGDYAYLKQHRVFSHSIPGLTLISLGLAGILSIIYPETGFLNLAFWAMLGALSHTFLDLFNSYGVGALWPITRKKYTVNLLTIFDPVLFALVLIMIFYQQNTTWSSLALGGLVIYMLFRFSMRYLAWAIVTRRLRQKNPVVRVVMLPAVNHFFKWEFIALLPERKIVGKVDLFRLRFRIVRHLHSLQYEVETALTASKLGQVFKEFTPFMHIECRQEGDKIIGDFMDLRYCLKDRFLHNGTLVMDTEMNVEECIFQPYSPNRRIVLEQ